MPSDPEQRLANARLRMDAVGHLDRDAWHAAWEDLLDAEREFGRSRAEPYAEVLDLGFNWDVGAPEPHVVSNSSRAFIVATSANQIRIGMART
jgi:hypothetical protein